MLRVQGLADFCSIHHLTHKLKDLDMNDYADLRTLLGPSLPTTEAMELFFAHEQAKIFDEQAQLEYNKQEVQQKIYEVENLRILLAQKQEYLQADKSRNMKEKESLDKLKVELDEERAQLVGQVQQLNGFKAIQFQRNQTMTQQEEKLGLIKIDLDNRREELEEDKLKVAIEKAQLFQDREQILEEKLRIASERAQFTQERELFLQEKSRIASEQDRFSQERELFLEEKSKIAVEKAQFFQEKEEFLEEKFEFEQLQKKKRTLSQQIEKQRKFSGRRLKRELGEENCLSKSDEVEHPALQATSHTGFRRSSQRTSVKREIQAEDTPLNPVKKIKFETHDSPAYACITPKPAFRSILKNRETKVLSSQRNSGQVLNDGGANDQPRLDSPESAQSISRETPRRRKLMVQTLDITHIGVVDEDIKEKSSASPANHMITMERGTEHQSSRRMSEPWQGHIKHILGEKLSPQ